MPKPLAAVVQYCDRLLQTETFEDWPGAVNGLQMENRGQVTFVAAAVDATLATIRLAIRRRADLLVVHHGLFWSPTYPWTGKRAELLRLLLENNLAVYSAHLPLDAHPTLGNAARLGREIGLRNLQPFFKHKGSAVGQCAIQKVARDELAERLNRVLGRRPTILPGGSAVCKKIGIVTGGAGSELKKAVEEGIDTLITGEGPHWTFGLAEELGVNVFYGGHYATETFGVKALAEHLAKKFRLGWQFLDHPSGL